MASESSRITVTLVDSKQNKTQEMYLLASLPTKEVTSIVLSQVTSKGEVVLSVTTLAAQQEKNHVSNDLYNPKAVYKHQLLSLMVLTIMNNLEKALDINIVVETGERYEAFRMQRPKATSRETIKRFILPWALRILSENLFEPTAVSQSYVRTDYQVSYTVRSGKESLAHIFVDK